MIFGRVRTNETPIYVGRTDTDVRDREGWEWYEGGLRHEVGETDQR